MGEADSKKERKRSVVAKEKKEESHCELPQATARDRRYRRRWFGTVSHWNHYAIPIY